MCIYSRSLKTTRFVRDGASSHSLSFPSRELLVLSFYWRLVELKINLLCMARFRIRLRIVLGFLTFQSILKLTEADADSLSNLEKAIQAIHEVILFQICKLMLKLQ